MKRSLSLIVRFCEALNARAGCIFSWLTLAAVLLMCVNVVMRYLFNSGAPWQTELVLAFHAATFLTAMGYTLQEGDQVRVDVLYTRFCARRKAWIDLFGTLFLLFPLCIVLMCFSWNFVESSWRLREASSEYRGMPGVFLLKSFLIIGPALLMLQGFAGLVRCIERISSPPLPQDSREEHG